MQTLLFLIFAACIAILAGWGIIKSGRWLWRWSDRVAERMAQRDCELAERLAVGGSVK